MNVILHRFHSHCIAQRGPRSAGRHQLRGRERLKFYLSFTLYLYLSSLEVACCVTNPSTPPGEAAMSDFVSGFGWLLGVWCGALLFWCFAGFVCCWFFCGLFF